MQATVDKHTTLPRVDCPHGKNVSFAQSAKRRCRLRTKCKTRCRLRTKCEACTNVSFAQSAKHTQQDKDGGYEGKTKDHNKKVRSSHNHPPTTQTKLVSEIKWFALRARVGHKRGASCEREIKDDFAISGGIHGGPGFARGAGMPKNIFDLRSQLSLRIPRGGVNARAREQKCRVATSQGPGHEPSCAKPALY